MSILIIGGEGYIGSTLKVVLNTNGYDVTTYGNRKIDYNLLTKEFLQAFEYIILLAGHSSVPSCVGELKSPWNNNVRNFSNLIEKLNKSQKVIYASSSSVYGSSFSNKCIETDQCLSFVNNYDLTKIVLDQLALNYINNGYQLMGLRFGTVVGPSSVIRRDILVNSMTYAALTKNEIYVANSHIKRPFLSLKDLCNGILKVLQSNKFISGLYNMANDNHNIQYYAEVVRQKTGATIIDNGNTAGVYDFQLNTDKFIDTYQFKYTDTIENVVEGLTVAYNTNNCTIVSRTEYFHYDG